MRQIKFRAWDKENKNMLYTKPLSPIKFMLSFSGEFGWFDLDKQMWSGIIPKRYYELMQYTGLKDRNGTEIYEGDIIEEYDDGVYHWVVKWDNECACFYLHEQNIGETFYLDDLVSVVSKGKVIGNIYEKPDLLEGEE